MKKRILPLILAISFFSQSCGVNVFQDVAVKDSAAALYEDALKMTDNMNYDGAYTKLSDIQTRYPDFASTDRFKQTKAGVEAGQCGLNFINFVDGLSSASGTQMFGMMMQAFRGTPVNPLKCVDSQATMATLSTVTDDQLLFLAVLGMTKVGTYLRARADQNGTNGDGTTDAGFDPCSTTTSSTSLDDNDMKQLITGFSLAIQNFGLIGGSFAGSSASSSITAIKNFCADPDGNPATNDAINCTFTDASAIDAVTVRTFRRLLQSYQFGLFNSSNPSSCDISGAPLGCCSSLAFP